MFRLATASLGMISVLAAVLGQPLRGLAQGDSVPPVAPPVLPASATPTLWNGWSAAVDAWERGEMARQAAWQQQLLLDDQLRYRLGVPLGRTPSFNEALATAPGGSAWALLPPHDRESWYAYGRPATGTLPPAAARQSVFEPWPFLPWDLYGLPVVPIPVPHPIAQHEQQTGPRRWESHPSYAASDRLPDPRASDQNYPPASAGPESEKWPSPKEERSSSSIRGESSRSSEAATPRSDGTLRPRGPKEH